MVKLWARFIHNGQHDDFTCPPKMPIFGGQSEKKGKKKADLTEATTDTAGAVVKYFSVNAPSSSSSVATPSQSLDPEESLTTPAGISPAKKVKLCS